MQARYYDPEIGRFYSNDPIEVTGVHSFNRYAYANNNPYKYTDPGGKKAEFIGDSKKPFMEAYSYLGAQSNHARSLFAYILNSKTPNVRIVLTNGGSHSIIRDPNKADTVYWNPEEGLITSFGTQSPATGLAHELIHVRNSHEGNMGVAKDNSNTVIQENIINDDTGEGKRANHGDGRAVRVSGGVTSRPKTSQTRAAEKQRENNLGL